MQKDALPPQPASCELPGKDARAEAAKLWQEVAKNEEARFNNLNTRALGVLTVAGLVTSIAGFFAKDLQSDTALGGISKDLAAGGLAAALLALTAAALVVVLGVLRPRRRTLFGSNALTETPGSLQSPDAVHAVTIAEYSVIAADLQARNARSWTRPAGQGSAARSSPSGSTALTPNSEGAH